MFTCVYTHGMRFRRSEERYDVLIMKAIVVSNPGTSSRLHFHNLPDRHAGPGQARIRIAAAGLNRADLLQRRGQYPPPPGTDADILGLEIAGSVIEAEDPTGRIRIGDRVMALLPGEGYAEEVVVSTELCLPVPSNLGFEEAAAIPEVFLTAYDALFRQVGLGLGETLLIHAVASGVGTAALQLAAAAGVETFGTSRTVAKLDRALELGLDHAFVPSRENLPDEIRQRTDGQGVHVLLDLVGSAYWPANLELLRELGRLIVVGLVSGRTTELDIGLLLRKRLRIFGTALRSRSLSEKGTLIREFGDRILPQFAAGRIRPIVDRVFDWSKVEEAHRYLESNQSFGKVVLSIP